MKAHVIQDGLVVDTIVVEDLSFPVGPDRSLIDGEDGGIGWSVVDGQLVPPTPPAQEPRTIFTVREYMAKFTDEEYGAALDSGSIQVRRVHQAMLAAQYIDVADPDTAAGLDLMVAEGIITPARRAVLLQPNEVI
ncbi:hypothetical protein [Bordetella genomosp. 1]|uniref:Uncharacterized protein n=1 Tax=Bordetella genomosp. 1 TaxID=1395607 RepID=A0ABX4EW72_9BORD|nr:hypothetical protein [Bordetella genomosp. 1]OZI58703.1 hypothetical protein CAL27_18650 [Bordetella genomosp. 1]